MSSHTGVDGKRRIIATAGELMSLIGASIGVIMSCATMAGWIGSQMVVNYQVKNLEIKQDLHLVEYKQLMGILGTKWEDLAAIKSEVQAISARTSRMETKLDLSR